MSTTHDWTCPYCGREVSLTANSWQTTKSSLYTQTEGVDGNLNYELQYIVCPRSKCRQYTLQISFFKRVPVHNALGSISGYNNGDLVLTNWLRPKGKAKPFPDFIPQSLRQDYEEACLILQDSPKASATLSRRCLQGLIRSYYHITKSRLIDEIKGLEEHLAPDLWKAVDAIRKVGNIGAHSEKDVNVIVDVPLKSARALVELIELLFEETYIKDNNRKQLIDKARQAATAVEDQKNSPKKESG